ncbi:hypothetical protein I4F81_006405 [Pyropia yezoensis]|uniref:Uncharacterized protein n=1 Tax=Pyropia yezoensis TaxID=2788 RepID=A0ACC3C0N5_PYRYE|nr:hypothetical protein I4F81_006405 [Neopyropia yezoensis]
MASCRRAAVALLAVFLAVATMASAQSSRMRTCADFIRASDSVLFYLLTDRSSIGGCYIQNWGGGSCALYAKSAVRGSGGDKGHPKNRRNGGTGCVGNSRSCYYRGSEYSLSSSDRADFCTSDPNHNVVAQIRHAMRTGACAMQKPPRCRQGLTNDHS